MGRTSLVAGIVAGALLATAAAAQDSLYAGKTVDLLIGFSAGGGFALHFAGSNKSALFDRYVLLAPYLGPWAPTNQPHAGGWAVAPAIRRP